MKADGIAYVVVPGNEPGKRIGAVKFGEDGYYEVRGWDDPRRSLADVKKLVEHLNERLGIPAEVAEAAFFGSMWGWHVPAAAPARRFYAD